MLKIKAGNSLAVQWLGLGTFTAEGLGSFPGWGTKTDRQTDRHTSTLVGELSKTRARVRAHTHTHTYVRCVRGWLGCVLPRLCCEVTGREMGMFLILQGPLEPAERSLPLGEAERSLGLIDGKSSLAADL